MASGGDEVEHGMDSVVSEAGVTLDTRLLGENVVVLSLEVTDDLGEAVTRVSMSYWGAFARERSSPGLVVDLVSESGGINNGQGDAGALLVQL